MARAFTLPEFLKEGTSAEEIQQKMMNSLPEDIDGMPGGFAYDFTMPTAIEKSEMLTFYLVRALMVMFPDWAWDDWLDLHGRQCGLQRKQATYATGYVTITGEAGTTLDAGFIFCTPATENTPSRLYALDEETTIPESGSVTAAITATEAGTGSNVAAGFVIIMSEPVNGIASITNEEAIRGGTERESDEDFRERIEEAFASADTSNIGNDSDYIRWALEVDGTGDCIVTQAWNGPGTVRLSIVDANGEPATDRLCEAVYEHIVSPEDRSARLMPTGSAELTVVPAETTSISYSCRNLEYDETTTDTEQIEADFKAALASYYTTAKQDGEVKYNMAHKLLTEVAGVLDFTDFQMNGGSANVELGTAVYPKTGEVTLIE